MPTDSGWVTGWEYDRRSSPVRGRPTDVPKALPCHAVRPGEKVAACGMLLAVVTTAPWPRLFGAHCRDCGEVVGAF